MQKLIFHLDKLRRNSLIPSENYSINYLFDKNFIDEDNYDIENLNYIDDVYQLEIFFKNRNLDDKQILDIFKSYFNQDGII